MLGFTVQIEGRAFLIKPSNVEGITIYTVTIDSVEVVFRGTPTGELETSPIHEGRVYDHHFLNSIAREIESRYL